MHRFNLVGTGQPQFPVRHITGEGNVFVIGLKTANLFLFAFLWAIVLVQSNISKAQGYTCFSTDVQAPNFAPTCGLLADNIPTDDQPIRTIKLAFHIMQREAPFPLDNFNLDNSTHLAYLNAIFNRVNDLYTSSNAPWCSGQYQAFLSPRDTRIRFELAGIFAHRDNLGFNNFNSSYGNLYCYNNYAYCKDEVLNVFFCETSNVTSGFGPPTHNMLFNIYDAYLQNGASAWGDGNLLGHEIGHTLGLGHSWLTLSTYPDLCQAAGQDLNWCDPETALNCTNNMMAYSKLNDFISPLQMSTMNQSLLQGPASKYMVIAPGNPLTISQQIATWDRPRVVNGDVILEAGATLTIKCHVIMAKDKRIIVKRGAKLIVDGGVISTKGPAVSTCDGVTRKDRWLGIEVWGNTSATTSANMFKENYTPLTTDPGIVILKNQAHLKFAKVGVYAQQRGTAWNIQQQHFGGMVQANDATFTDCRKAVEFISDVPIKNSSSFKNVKVFQTYLNPTLSNQMKDYEGITSWQVSWDQESTPQFDGCTFQGLNNGIVYGNASTIIAGCTFRLNKKSVDLKLLSPMLATNTTIGGAGSAKNTFIYCEYAVHGMAYGFALVKNNLIEDCRHGVLFEGPSLFRVEENEFKNTNGNNTPIMVDGVSLLQTEDGAENLVTCNQFNTLGPANSKILIYDGIFVGGQNLGASLLKNKFNTCWYDIRLQDLTYNGSTANGELPSQGSSLEPAFNRFSDFPTSPFPISEHKADIHTPSPTLGVTTLIEYFHPTGTCTTSRHIPTRPVAGTCAVSASNAFNFENNNAGSFPVPSCAFGPLNLIIKPEDCRTIECLNGYYAQIGQRDALLDPGKSIGLLTNIQTSPNGNATLSALSSASPYLSEEILAAVANSSMTGANKRNVLAANVPLSPYIMTLAEAVLSVSDLNLLVAQQQNASTSLRNAAYAERTTFNNKKMSLLRHLADSLYVAGDFTGADNLFAADPERFSKESRVGLKFQRGDLNGASQLLNNYPTGSVNDAEFKFIQTARLNHAVSAAMPSPADSTVLFDIAQSYSRQAGYAKSMVWFLYGAQFEPSIPLAAEDRSNHDPNQPAEKVETRRKDLFSLFPNPAGETLTIDLGENSPQTGLKIKVFSAQGILLKEQALLSPTTTLDISNFQTGFYLVSLIEDGKVRQSQYFVKATN